jgi:hypothetical protein
LKEKEITKELVKYIFSEDELKEISQEMARKINEQTHLEDELKAVKSGYKSQIDATAAAINSAATKTNNGYEMRNVECELERDFKLKRIIIRRTDTHEVVKERDMRPDELQMSIV